MLKQQELVIRELDTLPTEKIGEVLDFIRFLKIRAKSDAELEREFQSALAQARAIAAERGITEADIAEEIRQVRAQK
ncbi:MAG: hypothetical protein FJ009_11495 [Chloroflexi bacterium]|nr:hypothetical protein [Chloroflexota bacterium]